MTTNILKITLLLLACNAPIALAADDRETSPDGHSRGLLAALYQATRENNEQPLIDLINAPDFHPGDSEATEDGNIIHMVASYGLTQAMKAIIIKGFDLNAQTSTGRTPLMLANMYRQKEIAHMLTDALNRSNSSAQDSQPAPKPSVKTAIQALYKKTNANRDRSASTTSKTTRLSASDDGASSSVRRIASDDTHRIVAPQPRRGRGRGGAMRVPSPLTRETESSSV